MTTCTNPQAFSDLVEEFIAQYEQTVRNEIDDDVDSTPARETLDRLYAYRKAIKNEDYDYIRGQGISINDREARSELATQVYQKVFGTVFKFYEGNSSYLKNGVFHKAELVDGGLRISYYHRGKLNDFTFSLTSDGRSHTKTKQSKRLQKIQEYRNNSKYKDLELSDREYSNEDYEAGEYFLKIKGQYAGNAMTTWRNGTTTERPLKDQGHIVGSLGASGIELEQKFRGKGYGKLFYFKLNEKLNEIGVTLKSDQGGQISPEALAVWKSLVKDGLARKTTKNNGVADTVVYEFYNVLEEEKKGSKSSSINVPVLRKFLDETYLAEKQKLAFELVLGSSFDGTFELSEDALEKSYVHGNIDNMKDMLKKLHKLGGEKANDAELESHFNLLDKMDPKFFENLKLYVQKEAEKSQGVARPNRIDIKIKGDPISIGNQQSEASIYMEEVLHSMTSGALSSGTIKAQQLKRRLDHLVELGRKQLDWEAFLPAPEDSIDEEKEKLFAQQLHHYIFESEHRDYEFLAKGIAQPEIANALSRIKVRDTDGNKTLMERFLDLLELVKDVLTGNIRLKNKNQNVHDALITLAIDLGEINTKASRKAMEQPGLVARIMDIVLNDPDRYIANKVHDITEKSVGKLRKKDYERLESNNLYDRSKHMMRTVALSMMNPTYTKVMGSIASSYGLKPDGTIREIVSGLFQTEPAQKAAEFLVLAAGYVDKMRNEQIGITRDTVLYGLKEPMTKELEEAVTAVLSDTDLAALVGKNTSAYDAGIVKTRVFDNATLRNILENDEVLDKFIVEAKRALKDADATHYNWHSNQAVGLGIYLAKHAGTPEQNLNATNIAKGLGSSHRKGAKKSVVRAVDELATLVAIKNTNKEQRKAVAAFMKNDWRGFQHLADIVEGFKRNSIETVFKDNQTNMIKGYSREVFDDSIIMEVAPLGDRASMKAQGFTFKGKLAPKAGDPKKQPMALYVTDSASRPERLRGGVRLNQLRSKGTTITDAAYKEGEGFSNALIRERAKKEINDIQRESKKRIKAMEEGEYDFTDAVFGMMPLLDTEGKIVDYRYTMDKETKKNLLKQDTRISEVMARSFGSLLDKELSAEHNKKVLAEIRKDMEENWEEGTKGKDGLTDFTLIGPKVKDPEMRKLYYMLPKEFKEYINRREDNTLAVRTSLKNAYFGYSQLSVTDFPMLKKFTPQVIIKAVKILETIWMEMVQIAKTNILMKMPTVTLSNFFSNVIYLAMKGYDPVTIITMQVESYRAIKDYNKNVKRKQELLNREREILVALGRDNLPAKRRQELLKEKRRVKGELNAVKDRITSSRIHELVQMGLDQTVEDIASNVTRDTNRITQYFDKKMENLPSTVRTGVDYLFLTKRTAPYKVVNEFLEITDLMSRDIQNTLEKRTEERQANGQERLPSWWLDKQSGPYKQTQVLTGEERAKFLQEAEAIRKYELVEDYINYAMPSSQFEEYLNKVGILMFTKYVKRIQRIIAKTGGRGPIKTLIGLFGISYIGGLPTIHEQSFLAKDWYTDSIGPGNVFPVYSPIDIFMNVITPSLLKSSTYDVSI